MQLIMAGEVVLAEVCSESEPKVVAAQVVRAARAELVARAELE